MEQVAQVLQKNNRTLTLAALLVVTTMLAGTALAQENAAGRTDVALATTKDDLLVFWEEKDLTVTTATRTDKSLSETAENMAVITARDIEAMNAHSVDEVLNRVPGLFVDFAQPNFVASGSSLHFQGSASTHVAVLLDGVPFNLLSGNSATTVMIPLTIVERIEIVKGAASSAWGSALGGVVNIITKAAGDTTIPRGTLYGSGGEARSLDYGAELSGKGGPLGYYLHAGKQETRGLPFVGYDRDALFGKLTVAPTSDLRLTVSAGYTNPATHYQHPVLMKAGQNLRVAQDLSATYLNAEGEYRISDELSMSANLHSIRQAGAGVVFLVQSAQLWTGSDFADKTIGGDIRVNYQSGMHNAVLGGEGSNGATTSTTNFGPILQSALSLPASNTVYPEINRYAIYANDTVSLGPVSITPGVRYDHNDIVGSFVSPSLGLAWKLGEHTVARATAARGFTTPVLTAMQGGGPMLIANPSLKPEQVWSYQAGIESGALEYLNLSVTYFRHQMKDEITATQLNPLMQTYINGGDVRRQGYELGAETVPLYNLSLKAAFSYVRINADSEPEGRDNYLTQLRLRYDDRKSLLVDLYGQQIWLEQLDNREPKFNFIWDLTGSKRFSITDTTSAELFASVHNLFSGASFTDNMFPNAQRWVEGGLRFKF